MKRVIVIGCPGSGKSTFARKLQDATGLALYHLDRMFWNPDKTTVEKSLFLDRLSHVLSQEEWIIDGNFSSTMEQRMQRCDTVIFLDYPAQLCLDSVRQRIGKPRTDMPWVEEQEDPEFMDYIKNFNHQARPRIIALLEKYPEKEIHIFKNRDDAEVFLNNIKKDT